MPAGLTVAFVAGRRMRCSGGCGRQGAAHFESKPKKTKEPLTDPVSGSPSGAGGARTPDLLNAIQARSQLRHSPIIRFFGDRISLAKPGVAVNSPTRRPDSGFPKIGDLGRIRPSQRQSGSYELH